MVEEENSFDQHAVAVPKDGGVQHAVAVPKDGGVSTTRAGKNRLS